MPSALASNSGKTEPEHIEGVAKMERRDFLSSAAALGIGLATSTTDVLAQNKNTLPSNQAGKLTPPKEGLIPVAFAISRGTTNIDWVGPESVFQTWHFDELQKKHVPKFQLFTVGETLEQVGNFVPKYTFDTVPPAKVIVIPAQVGSPALLDWLRKMHETVDVMMSVCIGARHLAKAGLLKGKTATTHHKSIENFRKEFPEVNWVSGVRFVEGEKISTAGGLTAGIDLALRVHDRYFGRAATKFVSDHLEYQSEGWIV